MRTIKKNAILLGFSLTAVCSVFSGNQPAKFILKEPANGIAPWTHLQPNNNPENFQFVVVSDRTGGVRPGVFSNATEKINLVQPEFVLSVGDLITGYKKDPVIIEEEWGEFNEMVQSLQMPFFYVPGNHDFSNLVLADEWDDRFGPTYYCFKYNKVLFVVLNSQFIIDQSGWWLEEQESQLSFLKKSLKQAGKVRWTVLLLHHPLWTYQKEDAFGVAGVYDRWLEIEDLLKGRDYTVFAGHRHRYAKYERNGQSCITLATTGGGSKLRGVEQREFDHFLWVTMTDDGPIIANLLLDGILDQDLH